MLEISRAKIADMDDDEYRRMVEAGDQHWWYRSTRSLLEMLISPYSGNRRRQLGVSRCRWRVRRDRIVAGRPGDDRPRRLRADRVEGCGTRSCRLPGSAGRHQSCSACIGCFDAVLCVTALCHRMNPDPQAIVNEFARVTKPGGLVCLMEPGGKRLWRGHDDVTHTARRFSLAEMRAMVSGAGLDLVRATGAYSFLVPPAAVMGIVERGKKKSDVGRNRGWPWWVAGPSRPRRALVLRRVSLPFGLSRDRDRTETDRRSLTSISRAQSAGRSFNRFGAAAAGSAGHWCFGYRPAMSLRTSTTNPTRNQAGRW